MATLQGDRMVLLVDGTETQARFVSSLVARTGWRLVLAPDTARAVATLGTHDGLLVDAVLVDERACPDGLDATIEAMRSWRPQLPVIFLGDPLNRHACLRALAAGATDFLEKPLTAERLGAALDRAVSAAQGDLQTLSEKFPAALAVEEIIGSAPAFRTALAIAAKAARARVPLLIEGEAGTGKALLASAVHDASGRPRAACLEIDCVQHGEAMLGPLLFGHEKGAFAGAFDRRVGLLVQASGGTLVIDNIERLPSEAQRELVHAMQSGIVNPLGAAMSQPFDTRIIATSSTSLRQQASLGLFREDLLALLSVVEIRLPALRERRSDIPALTRHLITRIARLPGIGSLSITGEVNDALTRHDWPGNVRQLHDTLLRAATRAGSGQLTLADFPALQSSKDSYPAEAVRASQEGIGVTLYRGDGNLRPLADIEADVIRLAIGHYRGRMSEVARRLGIGRSTLYRKLADLGIDTAA